MARAEAVRLARRRVRACAPATSAGDHGHPPHFHVGFAAAIDCPAAARRHTLPRVVREEWHSHRHSHETGNVGCVWIRTPPPAASGPTGLRTTGRAASQSSPPMYGGSRSGRDPAARAMKRSSRRRSWMCRLLCGRRCRARCRRSRREEQRRPQRNWPAGAAWPRPAAVPQRWVHLREDLEASAARCRHVRSNCPAQHPRCRPQILLSLAQLRSRLSATPIDGAPLPCGHCGRLRGGCAAGTAIAQAECCFGEVCTTSRMPRRRPRSRAAHVASSHGFSKTNGLFLCRTLCLHRSFHL